MSFQIVNVSPNSANITVNADKTNPAAISVVSLVSGTAATLAFKSDNTDGVIASVNSNNPTVTFPTPLTSTKAFQLSSKGGDVSVVITSPSDLKVTGVATKRKAEVTEEDNKEEVKKVKTDAKKETPAKKEKEAKKETAKEATTPAKKEKEAPAAPAAPPAKNEPVKFSNGLTYKDIELGSGPAVKRGNRVGIRYQGMLTNGQIFDSNMPRGHLLEFTVGKGEVVTGFDLGVIGLQRGGKRRIIIPSKLGYGAAGAPPEIPPNATLIFDVELAKLY